MTTPLAEQSACKNKPKRLGQSHGEGNGGFQSGKFDGQEKLSRQAGALRTRAPASDRTRKRQEGRAPEGSGKKQEPKDNERLSAAVQRQEDW